MSVKRLIASNLVLLLVISTAVDSAAATRPPGHLSDTEDVCGQVLTNSAHGSLVGTPEFVFTSGQIGVRVPFLYTYTLNVIVCTIVAQVLECLTQSECTASACGQLAAGWDFGGGYSHFHVLPDGSRGLRTPHVLSSEEIREAYWPGGATTRGCF